MPKRLKYLEGLHAMKDVMPEVLSLVTSQCWVFPIALDEQQTLPQPTQTASRLALCMKLDATFAVIVAAGAVQDHAHGDHHYYYDTSGGRF